MSWTCINVINSAHTQYKLKIWTVLPGSTAYTQYARKGIMLMLSMRGIRSAYTEYAWKDVTLMLSMRGRLFSLCSVKAKLSSEHTS